MQNGITLAEYYNSLPDKAVDLAQFRLETDAVLKEELSNAEYQQSVAIIEKLRQGSALEREANPEPFILAASYLYVDKDSHSCTAPVATTKEGFVKLASLSLGTDLTRRFTDTHEKILRTEQKIWDLAEDQSPRITSGQLVKRKDRVLM
jgi:hypothetical protein